MTIGEGPAPVRTSTVGLSGREQRLVGVGQDRVGIDAHEKRRARGGSVEPRLHPDRKERNGIASVQCGDRLGLGWAEPGDGRGEAIAQPGLGCAGDPQRLPRGRVVAGGPFPGRPRGGEPRGGPADLVAGGGPGGPQLGDGLRHAVTSGSTSAPWMATRKGRRRVIQARSDPFAPAGAASTCQATAGSPTVVTTALASGSAAVRST